MSIKEQIVVKMQAAGYGMMESCEHATNIIREFLASGEKQKTYGIMGAHGKCVDTITLQRN